MHYFKDQRVPGFVAERLSLSLLAPIRVLRFPSRYAGGDTEPSVRFDVPRHPSNGGPSTTGELLWAYGSAAALHIQSHFAYTASYGGDCDGKALIWPAPCGKVRPTIGGLRGPLEFVGGLRWRIT